MKVVITPNFLLGGCLFSPAIKAFFYGTLLNSPEFPGAFMMLGMS